MKKTALILVNLILFFATIPTFTYAAEKSLYPHPPSPVYQAGDRELSCKQLEIELSTLEPLTYSYKPGFYTDPAHGVAIWGGVLASPVWSYFVYSGLAEYYDRQRMIDARHRIAVLRRLKAYRRCYE